MVLITKIKVENLRGIKKAEINGLKQVNIFIGRNGVGKSTILEAIYLASAWCKEDSDILKILDRAPSRKIDYIIYRRGLRGDWATAKDFLWYNLRVEVPIKIGLEFSNNGSRKALDFVILHNDDYGKIWLDIKDLLLEELKQAYFLEALKAMSEGEEQVFEVAKIHSKFQSLVINFPLFNYKYKEISDYTAKKTEPVLKGRDLKEWYVQIINKAFKEVIEYLDSIIFLDDFIIRDIEKFEHIYWKSLLKTRGDKLLIKMLNEGLEADVENLTYAPVDSGYVLMVLLKNTSVRVDDLGSGSRDALIRLMPLITVKNTAALLEEPENHLHPGGLQVFMKYLLRVAKENRLQLFISTHSIELVYFAYKLSEEIGIDTRVFFLEKDEDGAVSYRILEKIDIDTLRKLGLDPRFLDII